jgi:hypothetical protein
LEVAAAMAPEEGAYESALHFPCPEGARHATDAEVKDFWACQGRDDDGYYHGGWDEFSFLRDYDWWTDNFAANFSAAMLEPPFEWL